MNQIGLIYELIHFNLFFEILDLAEEKIRESYEEEKPIVVIDGYNMIEIDRDDKIDLYKSEKKLKIVKVDGQASLFEPTFKVAMSSQNINK